jgi:S-adenosylmethionine hydrolase
VARTVATYGELGVGELGLVIDSCGLVVIAADRSSAAEELELAAGDAVTLTASDAALDAVTTQVVLGRHPEETPT